MFASQRTADGGSAVRCSCREWASEGELNGKVFTVGEPETSTPLTKFAYVSMHKWVYSERYTKPGGTAGVELCTLVPAIDIVWDESFLLYRISCPADFILKRR